MNDPLSLFALVAHPLCKLEAQKFFNFPIRHSFKRERKRRSTWRAWISVSQPFFDSRHPSLQKQFGYNLLVHRHFVYKFVAPLKLFQDNQGCRGIPVENPWLEEIYLKNNPRFFQQVSSHVGSDDLEGCVEIDLDVFPEPRRVVVSSRFRISDGLHDWGWGKNSVER